VGRGGGGWAGNEVAGVFPAHPCGPVLVVYEIEDERTA